MKPPRLILGLFALLAALALPLAAAQKADLTLNDGKVLKGARIVTITDKEVTIVHAGGMASVATELVPLEALARAHAEIEVKAGDRNKHASQVAARDAERLATQMQANETRQRVAGEMAALRANEDAAKSSAASIADRGVAIDAELRVLQVLSDGILATGKGEYGAPREVSRSGTGLDSHKLYARDRVTFPDKIFVRCATGGLYDGANVSLKIWRAGTYRYTAVTGAISTVKGYTTEEASAQPGRQNPLASTPDLSKRLADLKAKFPPKRAEKMNAYINGRSQSFEIDVPTIDVWSKYRGSIQTATREGLAITLARAENDITADLAKFSEQADKGSEQTGKEQARRTVAWLRSTLRPYLAQLRAISEGR